MKRLPVTSFDERGAYSVLSACLIAALITFAGYSLNATYSRSVSADLQAAADAAAHAGAKALCATQECWENSAVIAQQVIYAQLFEQMTGELSSVCRMGEGGEPGGGGPGGGEEGPPGDGWEQELCYAMRALGFPGPPGGGPGDAMDKGGLDVDGFFNIDRPIIERGRWTPELGFESVESPTWQNDNPGKPRSAYVNAVRVRLRRPHITIMKLPFTKWEHAVEIEALAVADTVKEERIAPFAIPVCALMEREDTFADFQKDVSKADRLFGRADRFCPSGDCDILPAFAYGICENDPQRYADDPNTSYFADAESAELAITSLGLPFSASDEGHYCLTQHMKPTQHDQERAGGDNWAMHNRQPFIEIWNSYGLVGLPEGAGGAGPGMQEDDLLTVLQQALVDKVNVRAKIGDRFYILPEGLTSSIAGDDIWSIIAGINAPHETRVGLQESHLGTLKRNLNYYLTSAGHAEWLSDMDQMQTVHHQGLCPSRRMEIDAGDSTVNGDETMVAFQPAQSDPDQIPVWRVRVPVIADVDSDEPVTCPGLRGVSGADQSGAPPVPDHQWEIIGFVTAEIFDVSIGRPAERAADEVPGFPSEFPWGFETDGDLGTRENCNVVRARIVGSTNFIAGANSDQEHRRPLLVSSADY